ncbi:hypothetical protein J6590_091391 [Homalodisca vitripennis]|nr:hypothetical protein J6590_091391 [Homalodisca vitripennis]
MFPDRSPVWTPQAFSELIREKVPERVDLTTVAQSLLDLVQFHWRIASSRSSAANLSVTLCIRLTTALSVTDTSPPHALPQPTCQSHCASD